MAPSLCFTAFAVFFCNVLILLALMPYFANRLSLIDLLFDFYELTAAAENRLFKGFRFSLNHCLHQLQPEERNTIYLHIKEACVYFFVTRCYESFVQQ